MDTCKLHIIFLYLQCVFHSIRFKVNNMGSRRWPIFFAIIFTFKTYSGSPDISRGKFFDSTEKFIPLCHE